MTYRLLILTEDYPSNGRPYAMSYVHSRSTQYLENSVSFEVGSFRCKEAYQFEEVQVNPVALDNLNRADIIFSHAPNIRNHFRYLWHIEGKTIVFFFHGHEVLRSIDYPAPFPWRKNKWSEVKAIYDTGKLLVLPNVFSALSRKNDVRFIFVSEWMKTQFFKNIRLKHSVLRCCVIPNSAHPIFIKNNYHPETLKRDIVTIRPLDDSKYAIDLVIQNAVENPELSFDIYGKGDFFRHNSLPNNVRWIDRFVPQSELPNVLNRYGMALMPTRYDAQGVLACEMATFGMPIVTSDLPICREMLGEFANVRFINNLQIGMTKLAKIMPTSKVSMPTSTKHKFDSRILAKKELSFATQKF